MTDDLIPEVGDIVEYGVAVRDPYGNLMSAAPRGKIIKVWKNGNIIIDSERGGKRTLTPLEFTILSKGD